LYLYILMICLMNNGASNTIEATVDRWEGDFVVLRTSDGQELLWPGDHMPTEISEGSVVRLALLTDLESTEDRRELAKNILNEIFDTSSGAEE